MKLLLFILGLFSKHTGTFVLYRLYRQSLNLSIDWEIYKRVYHHLDKGEYDKAESAFKVLKRSYELNPYALIAYKKEDSRTKTIISNDLLADLEFTLAIRPLETPLDRQDAKGKEKFKELLSSINMQDAKVVKQFKGNLLNNL